MLCYKWNNWYILPLYQIRMQYRFNTSCVLIVLCVRKLRKRKGNSQMQKHNMSHVSWSWMSVKWTVATTPSKCKCVRQEFEINVECRLSSTQGSLQSGISPRGLGLETERSHRTRTISYIYSEFFIIISSKPITDSDLVSMKQFTRVQCRVIREIVLVIKNIEGGTPRQMYVPCDLALESWRWEWCGWRGILSSMYLLHPRRRRCVH